jgi:hypothetical protein
MTDEALCNALRYEKWDEAADRIEALTAENERLERVVEDLSDEVDLAEQEASMVEDDFVKAEKEIEALTAKLAKAVEALLWCSGSADFNEGGIARKGWLKVCAPIIHAEIEGSNDP